MSYSVLVSHGVGEKGFSCTFSQRSTGFRCMRGTRRCWTNKTPSYHLGIRLPVIREVGLCISDHVFLVNVAVDVHRVDTSLLTRHFLLPPPPSQFCLRLHFVRSGFFSSEYRQNLTLDYASRSCVLPIFSYLFLLERNGSVHHVQCTFTDISAIS